MGLVNKTPIALFADDTYGEVVCIPPGGELRDFGPYDLTIGESDARKIAAAPDLIAALEGTESLLAMHLEWDHPTWAAVRAALAKARGRMQLFFSANSA